MEKEDFYALSNLAANSEVEYTLTMRCFLKDFSSDQMLQFNLKAKAKYSISFDCGEISLASETLSIKSSNGTNLILNFITLIKLSKSSLEKPDLSLISSLFFSSSASILNGAKNSVSFENNIF